MKSQNFLILFFLHDLARESNGLLIRVKNDGNIELVSQVFKTEPSIGRVTHHKINTNFESDWLSTFRRIREVLASFFGIFSGSPNPQVIPRFLRSFTSKHSNRIAAKSAPEPTPLSVVPVVAHMTTSPPIHVPSIPPTFYINIPHIMNERDGLPFHYLFPQMITTRSSDSMPILTLTRPSISPPLKPDVASVLSAVSLLSPGAKIEKKVSNIYGIPITSRIEYGVEVSRNRHNWRRMLTQGIVEAIQRNNEVYQSVADAAATKRLEEDVRHTLFNDIIDIPV